MIEGLVSYIETVLLPLGAWGVFFATLLEQIVAPIPSAFVQLGGGFFLVQDAHFAGALITIFLLVALPSACAVGIGSLLVYYIAYVLGKKLVDRWGRLLGISWRHVERLQERFDNSRKDDVLLLTLRSLPAVPTIAVDIFCGVARYPVGKYIVLTFIGTFIRATVFGLIGWKVGGVYVTYAEYIAHIEQYIILSILVILGIFVAFKVRRGV